MASQENVSRNEALNLRQLIEGMPLPASSFPSDKLALSLAIPKACGIPTAKRTGGPPGSQLQEGADGEPSSSKKSGGLVVEDFTVGDSQWEVWSQSLSLWMACEVKGVFINATIDDNWEAPARSIKVQSKNAIKYIRELNIATCLRPKRNDCNSAGATGSEKVVVVAVSEDEPDPEQADEKAAELLTPRPKAPDAPVSKRPKMMSSVCDMEFKLESVPADLMSYIKDLVPNGVLPSDVDVKCKFTVCYNSK